VSHICSLSPKASPAAPSQSSISARRVGHAVQQSGRRSCQTVGRGISGLQSNIKLALLEK
jgi:hypothetical protein